MSAAPTFDELADAALLEMQRQQREQQDAIQRQISKNPFDAAVTTSTTVGGRTIVRKTPANPSPTNHSSKALSTAPQPAPAPPRTTSAPAAPNAAVSPASGATSPASPAAFDPAAEPSLPAAPAEEVHNLEIAQLNETNVAALLSQQKANAYLTSHLSTALSSQLQSIQAQQSKLSYIRSELAKLDVALSENINTLRSEIEAVGREVLYAQTEFDKREKEYLEARKLLAKVKQRKLLLTGHLDYIILTNEQDKAKKLKELERRMFGPNDDNAPDEAAAGKAENGTVDGVKATSPVAAVQQQPQPVAVPVAAPAFGGFGEDESGSNTGAPGGARPVNGQVNGNGRR